MTKVDHFSAIATAAKFGKGLPTYIHIDRWRLFCMG